MANHILDSIPFPFFFFGTDMEYGYQYKSIFSLCCFYNRNKSLEIKPSGKIASGTTEVVYWLKISIVMTHICLLPYCIPVRVFLNFIFPKMLNNVIRAGVMEIYKYNSFSLSHWVAWCCLVICIIRRLLSLCGLLF